MKIILNILILFPFFSFAAFANTCLESEECLPSEECRVFKCVEINLEQKIVESKDKKITRLVSKVVLEK